MARGLGNASQRPRTSPQRGQGIPFGALALIVVGTLLLLQTTGVLAWDLWLTLWRFWPVFLIALGFHLLLARQAPWLAALAVIGLLGAAVAGAAALSTPGIGSPVTEMAEPLDGLTSADVHITFGAGTLRLTSLDKGSLNLVEGQFQGRGAEASVDRSGSAGTVRLSMETRRWLHSMPDTEWDLGLSPGPVLTLSLDGGAGDMVLDLEELQVRDVDLNLGAASAEVTVPAAAGLVRVAIDAGAADVVIRVPDGVAARISSSCFACSLDIDGRRFPRTGDVYESLGFPAAENRASIDVRAGAASIVVR